MLGDMGIFIIGLTAEFSVDRMDESQIESMSRLGNHEFQSRLEIGEGHSRRPVTF